MAICGMYEIVNLYDGRMTAYVGSSQNVQARWGGHKSSLRHGSHRNVFLQRAWNKYGKQAFEFGMIEEVGDAESLIEREQYWLDEYRASGRVYNMGKCAESPMLGRHHSAETRRKLSEIQKGKKLTAEHRRKISEGLKGRPVSEKARRALRAANLNKHVSEETRRKISLAVRRANKSPETIRRRSEAQKGKKLSKETRQRITDALTGKKHSEEWCRHIGEGNAREYPALFNLVSGEHIPAGRNFAALCQERGWNEGNARMLISDQRRSCQDWILAENAKDAVAEGRIGKKGAYRAKAYPAFSNVKTGEIIPAGWNISKMCREHGLSISGMKKVAHGKNHFHGDWLLKEIVDNLDPEEMARQLEINVKRYPALVNIDTGASIVSGFNLSKTCREHKLNYRCIRRVARGERRIHKGWVLASNAPDTLAKVM